MPRNKAKTGGRKGKRTTQEQYEKLVDSHREDLGNHTLAAKTAAVSYDTALRAFKNGLGKNKPPIRTIIAREMVEARAQLAKYSDSDAETRETAVKAAKDVADSRAMQARSLRMSRNNAIAAMGLGSNLLRAGLKLSMRVEKLMESEDWEPTPKEAISLLRGVTDINRQAAEMANITEEMERRILGQPDLVVAHMDMTPDQAVTVLADGARTLDRMRRRAARGDLPPGVSAKVIDVEAQEVPRPEPGPPAQDA